MSRDNINGATRGVAQRLASPEQTRPARRTEDSFDMRHFSCDLCGKTLNPGAETRYVVRVESYPVTAPAELSESDLDQDHIEAMAEMLEALEESSDARTAKPTPTGAKSEHDLCGACHRKFLADPLGREQKRKLHFSKN